MLERQSQCLRGPNMTVNNCQESYRNKKQLWVGAEFLSRSVGGNYEGSLQMLVNAAIVTFLYARSLCHGCHETFFLRHIHHGMFLVNYGRQFNLAATKNFTLMHHIALSIQLSPYPKSTTYPTPWSLRHDPKVQSVHPIDFATMLSV